MTDRQTLEAAIAALQAQRARLGDAVVDAALGPMRERLAQLGDGAAPEQTLRQVSVLFLDVVGSTALSRHLDPEDVHAVMDGTLQRCTAVVQAHGGSIAVISRPGEGACFEVRLPDIEPAEAGNDELRARGG